LNTSGASGTRGNLESLIGDALAALANASLNLDPSSTARLAALDGRQIRIVAELPPPAGTRHFTLEVADARLRVYPRDMESPNVIVSGTVADLARWLLTGQTGAGAGLRIEGDTTVLMELAGILRGFRPDLGGPLGKVVGAENAASLLGAGEMALAGLRSAAEAMSGSLRQGAAERFVNRQQMAQFLDTLDDLKLRVDRLGARVSAEEARRQQP
jgi:ubiquinone biosynthesis protein UbiJ